MNRQSNDDNRDVSELIKFLNKEIESRENLSLVTNENKPAPLSNNTVEKSENKKFNRNVSNGLCIFCDDKNCDSFKCNKSADEKVSTWKVENSYSVNR